MRHSNGSFAARRSMLTWIIFFQDASTAGSAEAGATCEAICSFRAASSSVTVTNDCPSSFFTIAPLMRNVNSGARRAKARGPSRYSIPSARV